VLKPQIIIRSIGTGQIAVVTGSKQNNWVQSEIKGHELKKCLWNFMWAEHGTELFAGKGYTHYNSMVQAIF
jgi:hypothetical protein